MYIKNISAVLLSGLLLSGMSAQALTPQMTNNIILSAGFASVKGALEANNVPTTPPVQDMQSVTFNSLENKIRTYNQSIKSFEKTLASINSTDVSLQFFQQKLQYDQQNDVLKKQADAYTASANQLRSAAAAEDIDEATKNALIAQSEAMSMLAAQAQATITMNNAIVAGLDDAEEDAQHQLDDTYASTKKQLSNAADQIVIGAQTQYITLVTIDNNIAALERSIAAIDRTIPVMQTQLEIGIASELDLKTLQNQRDTAQSSLESIITQKESLQNSLSVMLGNDASTTVTVEDLPDISYDMKKINYANDLESAMKNSYTIWEKQDALRKASNDYEDDVTSTLDAYDAAKLDLEAAKVQTENGFKALYQTLLEKQRLLEQAKENLTLAEQNFEVSKVKYSIGNISKLEYENEKDTLENAKDAIKTAEVELFTAYNNYQWGIKGVI